MSSVLGNRYVESDENKKMLYIDATNLYGHSMSQPLPYDEFEMWVGHPDLYMKKSEEFLRTLDESFNGYFFEVDKKYPDNIKEKRMTFPFCPENNVNCEDKCNDCMKKIKPENYAEIKKLICDWSDN